MQTGPVRLRLLHSRAVPLVPDGAQGPAGAALQARTSSSRHKADLPSTQASGALGLTGPAWRTLDITFAQWLLARTFGHIVGAQHPATLGEQHSCSSTQAWHNSVTSRSSAGMSNAFYALCILGCFTVAEAPTLGGLGLWLLVTLVGIVAVKLVVEGPSTFPKCLHSWAGLRCLGKHLCCLLLWLPLKHVQADDVWLTGGFLFAFAVFPLPALRPKVYWCVSAALTC